MLVVKFSVNLNRRVFVMCLFQIAARKDEFVFINSQRNDHQEK